MQKNRTRDYYRKMRKKFIHHKKFINQKCFGYWNMPFYDCDGKYSKGKIHCSCPICASKTRIYGWKISDQRKLDKLNYLD